MTLPFPVIWIFPEEKDFPPFDGNGENVFYIDKYDENNLILNQSFY
jgi:hypothetical protein